MAGYHRRELLEMNAGENAYIPLGNTLAHDWIAKASFKRGRNRLEAGYIGVDVNGAGRLDKIEQGDVRRYNNDDHFGWLRWHHRSGGTIKRLKLWAGAHVTDEIRLRDSCHKTDGAVTNKDACIQGIDDPSQSETLSSLSIPAISPVDGSTTMLLSPFKEAPISSLNPWGI